MKKSFLILLSVFLFINIVNAQQNTLEDGKENKRKSLFSEDKNSTLEQMKNALKSVNLDLLDFIGGVKNPTLQKRYYKALKTTIANYKFFLDKVKESTADITDSAELYKEKINLGKTFNLLLKRRFNAIEKKLKTVKSLNDYRYRWFERAIYVYLRARIQFFNYKESLKFGVDEEELENYKKKFDFFMMDFTEFIAKKKALYEQNSVYYKRVFLIDDEGSYTAKDSQSFGDPLLLLEFLKGRFRDYHGLYAQVATFNKSEYAGTKQKGIILMMRYQPIPKNIKITGRNSVKVVVEGDNLEDILSFMINQASKLIDLKASSKKSIIKISTKNAKYSQMIRESLLLSKTAILRARLISKRWKKIKTKNGEKKVLEATLKIYTGKKAPSAQNKKEKQKK